MVKIREIEIKPKKSVTLLDIEIDDKLHFVKHVSTISEKANNQLNAVCKTAIFLGQKEKE